MPMVFFIHELGTQKMAAVRNTNIPKPPVATGGSSNVRHSYIQLNMDRAMTQRSTLSIYRSSLRSRHLDDAMTALIVWLQHMFDKSSHETSVSQKEKGTVKPRPLSRAISRMSSTPRGSARSNSCRTKICEKMCFQKR